MWIHEKDEVKMGTENLVVTSVYGLYSSSPVTISLENATTKETKTFTLLEFNQLHTEGKVKITSSCRGRKAHYA
jgi:hypothetical protein